MNTEDIDEIADAMGLLPDQLEQHIAMLLAIFGESDKKSTESQPNGLRPGLQSRPL